MKFSRAVGLIENKPYRIATLVVIVLALLGGFGIFAQTGATNLPLDPPNGGDALYPNLPGVVDKYPPVVAYVDGHAIAGKLLAIRVAGIQQSKAPNVDKSHDVRDALHAIIQDQILIDHAPDYGITVSYDEARAQAQQQKEQILNAPVPEAQADVAARARQMGLTVDQYFKSPSVIQTYREGMILGKMRQYVLKRSPISKVGSEGAEQAAFDAFTDGIHANVRILIDVP